MSHHHTDDLLCLLCLEKISTAHLKLQDIWNLIKTEFKDCHISWCFRDEENQNSLYHEGKTRCMWPNSKHNTMVDQKPCAQAMDLFQLSSEGIALFPLAYYKKIAAWLIATAQPIVWTGQWTMAHEHIVESDHFQLSQPLGHNS